VPSLVYQNSGQIQVSYRFAVDWLPLVLVAIGIGGIGGIARRRLFATLVVVGALFHVTAAWYFARQPGRLFVGDPLGWPFEAELIDR
jgi:hypothetical protein